jgi:hypothetical protein
MADEEDQFAQLLKKEHTTLQDYNIDAFADGVVAHRSGLGFHENPHGTNSPTIQRLSWHMGWNERALQQRR